MLAMLGLGVTDNFTNSKTNTATSSNSALNNSAAAALQLQTLLGIPLLGTADATTASALTSLLAGVPLNALMGSIGMPSNSKSSLLNFFGSNSDDVLNLTKRKTGNANSLSLNSSTSNKSNLNKANTSKPSISNDSKNSTSNNLLENNLAHLGQMSITELLTASKWPAGENTLNNFLYI